MSAFTLVPYTPRLKEAWDKAVASSKNGNFLHRRDYMDYHAHRFDEQSVMIMRKAKPVAVFPCTRHADAIVSHAGLTYAGLIYAADLHAVDVMDIFGMLTAHYKMLGADSILYKAIPHIFHAYPAEEDLYALFRIGARLVRRDVSSVVALGHRIKLSDSRKNSIRKAEKNHAVFLEDVGVESFYPMLRDVLRKFDAEPTHSEDELRLLKSRFPENIRIFGAGKSGELLAGAMVYDFGAVVHAQYLASSEDGRNIGALDFLMSYLLDDIYSDRKYFSFGISTEKNGMYLNEGLIFQKEGLGGRAIVHDFYEVALK